MIYSKPYSILLRGTIVRRHRATLGTASSASNRPGWPGFREGLGFRVEGYRLSI